MRVLLTGATGYIGHQLAIELAAKGFQVNALIRDLESLKIPKHKNISIFKGDICDYESILKAIKSCHYVFHTAAYTNMRCKKIDNFYRTNVLGTENLLKASLENNIKKLIYTSTLSVFGPSLVNVPITELQPRLSSYANDYELTKSISEQVVHMFVEKGLPCTILNVSKVYGPGLESFSNGVNKLCSMIIRNKFLVVPNKLNISSNYVFIGDVVSAHLLALKFGKSGENYIIGGTNINYESLFNIIKIESKSSIKIVKVKYKTMKTFLWIVNIFRILIGSKSLVNRKVMDSLFTNRISSSKKAISKLNYEITPIEIGLNKTIKYLIK